MTKVWIYHKWGRFREWRAFDDISTLAKHKLALHVPYSKGFEKSTHVFQHLHSPDTLSQENMFKINEHQLKMVILLSCKRRCDIYVMYMCVCVCVCVWMLFEYNKVIHNSDLLDCKSLVPCLATDHFSSPSDSDWLSHPNSLFSNGHWWLFPEGKAARSCKDTVPILLHGTD